MGQALLIAIAASCAGGAGPAVTPTPTLVITVVPITPTEPPSGILPRTPMEEPSPPSAEPQGGEIPPTAEETAGTVTHHVVEPGDTLLGLAKKYGVPMAAIQLQNQMGGSTDIQAGQTLSIPSSAAWADSSAFWVVHEVEAGETLIGIARRYGTNPERLQAVNNLEEADRLTVAQELVLPLTGPAPLRAPSPTQPPVASGTGAPPATAVAPESPEPTDVPQPAVPPGVPPADLADWPREVARLINEVRGQHGIAPLTYHSALEQAAQAQADDCAQRGWCSHTGSDGSDIRTRVLRTGYQPSTWAECWAQTQSPRRAVEVWMNETPPNDPHRRTLLSERFSEIGIGVADATWGAYILAVFGHP